MTGGEMAVYDGTRFIGEIRERSPGRWEARGPDGEKLGTFPTRHEASAAVSRHATLLKEASAS